MTKKICVFCGSSKGNNLDYLKQAENLGKELARRNYELIYGGANVGLMGMLASTCLDNGVRVTGIMPQHLVDLGVLHQELSELKIVKTMHERKKLMSEMADAFIALPGGLGTIEELFEICTWQQLGLHAKPVALLNCAGFYDALLLFLEHVVHEGFFRREHLHLLIVEPDVKALLDKIEKYSPVNIDKWFDVEANKV